MTHFNARHLVPHKNMQCSHLALLIPCDLPFSQLDPLVAIYTRGSCTIGQTAPLWDTIRETRNGARSVATELPYKVWMSRDIVSVPASGSNQRHMPVLTVLEA